MLERGRSPREEEAAWTRRPTFNPWPVASCRDKILVVSYTFQILYKEIHISANHSEKKKNKKNDIFGIPSDVALVRYVEQNASTEGIRQRYHAS